MDVSAFLITRNHEESLAGAIRSVAGFAAEVLVIDTGSTDWTVAIATELGAKVLPFHWQDDFAAACNEAIARARGEWLLWMNPDEELEPSGIAALTDAIARPTACAWQLGVRQLRHPDDPASGTLGYQPRLFRRDPAIRFHGRLHPEFDPPLEDIAARRGQSIGTVHANIRRHAYLSRPTPDKMRWVVRLLEKELEDRPGQLGYLIELGRNLLWLNDPHGHAVLARAANDLQARTTDPSPPTPWIGSLIEYLLTVSPEQSLSPLGRAEARLLAECWFPTTPPVLWAVASERFAAGAYAESAALLERLLQLGRTADYDDPGGFDPDIIGAAAEINYGLCCLHLERWEEAKLSFSRVVDHPARREAALRGFRLAELKRKPQRQ